MPEPVTCCEDMRSQDAFECDLHPDTYYCPDRLVWQDSRGRRGIPIRDGGSSYAMIKYCPWCGARLQKP